VLRWRRQADDSSAGHAACASQPRKAAARSAPGYAADPERARRRDESRSPIRVVGAVFAPEIGAAASAAWNSVRAAAKNVSIDGPSPGAWYANGRIVGLRWKQSQWGIRLDLHPMKGDPTNTPVLHLNVGPLGRGEAGHITLYDPRWFTSGGGGE
jgi:hypothetical protein